MADVFDIIKLRYWANANRIGGLILLAKKVGGDKEGAMLRGQAADVLRSAVVFLHASFEDALRTLGRHRLGKADRASLEAIQEALGTRQKPHRWLLTELALHRDKSIGHFVDEVIATYLSSKSFSSTAKVGEFLPMIGLKVADFNDLFPSLDELMKRRHQIVHTADLDRHDDPEPRALGADDAAAMEVWASTVTAFVVRMLSRLDAPDRVKTAEHLVLAAKVEEDLKERLDMRKKLLAGAVTAS